MTLTKEQLLEKGRRWFFSGSDEDDVPKLRKLYGDVAADELQRLLNNPPDGEYHEVFPHRHAAYHQRRAEENMSEEYKRWKGITGPGAELRSIAKQHNDLIRI